MSEVQELVQELNDQLQQARNQLMSNSIDLRHNIESEVDPIIEWAREVHTYLDDLSNAGKLGKRAETLYEDCPDLYPDYDPENAMDRYVSDALGPALDLVATLVDEVSAESDPVAALLDSPATRPAGEMLIAIAEAIRA